MKLKIVLCLLSAGCVSSGTFPNGELREVYVADFESDAPEACDASSVPMDHGDAENFFQRATVIDHRTIHDHYDVAPCRLVGSLVLRGEPCSWEISPSYTGSITCSRRTIYLACNQCKDLFHETVCESDGTPIEFPPEVAKQMVVKRYRELFEGKFYFNPDDQTYHKAPSINELDIDRVETSGAAWIVTAEDKDHVSFQARVSKDGKWTEFIRVKWGGE